MWALRPLADWTTGRPVDREAGVIDDLCTASASVRQIEGAIVAFGSDDGSPVRVDAETGSLEAIVVANATMRPGVVLMSLCCGGLPDDRLPFAAIGASTNLLTRTDRVVGTVNAMPRLSAIPVRVAPREG